MPHAGNMATIGILTYQIQIPHSHSLKEKRRVLKSMKDQIHNQFNVSIAEIEGQDKWQLGTLAVAMIGNEKPYIDAQLQKIVGFLQAKDDFQLLQHRVEYF